MTITREAAEQKRLERLESDARDARDAFDRCRVEMRESAGASSTTKLRKLQDTLRYAEARLERARLNA